jgi:uncharacterized protein (TIGR03435 family)
MMGALSKTAIALAGLAILTASTPDRFDVASIRPNLTEGHRSSITRSGGRITLENTTLRDCIAFAYGIPSGKDYELSGPGWMDTAKFDIAATFPAEIATERVRQMLQTMLAERFALTTHAENRNIESYVLVVGKKGPKLAKSSESSDGAFTWGESQLTARSITMAGLANRLSGPNFKLSRPVVDMTGIKGAWDFVLKWASDDAPAEDRTEPSIFIALQEQLGLRLEPRKIAFRIVVVDSIAKTPTQN